MSKEIQQALHKRNTDGQQMYEKKIYRNQRKAVNRSGTEGLQRHSSVGDSKYAHLFLPATFSILCMVQTKLYFP